MTEMVFRNTPEQIMISAIVGVMTSFALLHARIDFILTILLGISSFIGVYSLFGYLGWGNVAIPKSPEDEEMETK
jgi:hypothetical protein